MRLSRLARRVIAVAMAASTVTIQPYSAGEALGQEVPQQICGASASEAPRPIGQPDANGWTSDQESLGSSNEVRRYRFGVKEKGTAYVYVGDQWYDLNLGLYSMTTGADVGCWAVQVRGTSTESERHRLGFVRPDERAIEVEPGDYILTARPADGTIVDPSRNFTVRVAVGPRACALQPANTPVPEYPGMTNKPDNPDLFQLGVTFQPDASELGPFTLMSFNAFLSPPFTDLFEFTWEIDGQVIPGETGPTVLKPYAELPKTTLGVHTVKLTAKAVREYQDPTESRYNVLPFDGDSRSVSCQFRGQA
jgi:hypothetical protein